MELLCGETPWETRILNNMYMRNTREVRNWLSETYKRLEAIDHYLGKHVSL